MSGYVATQPDAYERSMGRWSRLLAARVVEALDLPRGGAILDAGCGTGALAGAIAARDPPRASPASMSASPSSPPPAPACRAPPSAMAT